MIVSVTVATDINESTTVRTKISGAFNCLNALNDDVSVRIFPDSYRRAIVDLADCCETLFLLNKTAQ